jgi:SNF2 family DNA or RNA helicase
VEPGGISIELSGAGSFLQHLSRCREIPGARYNGATKLWSAPGTQGVAAAIIGLWGRDGLEDGGGLGEFLDGADRREEAASVLQSRDAPEVPGETTKSWRHQRIGFHFARQLDAAYLAFAMGGGKSKVAIDLLRTRGAKRVLIVCPHSVAGVWPRQIAQHWGADSPRVLMLDRGASTKRASMLSEALDSWPSVVAVVNYDVTWREPLRSELLGTIWDAAVLDEAHRIKAPGGSQSLFCLRLRDRAKYRLCLSGTPMPHSPLDIYAQYRFLDPGIFGASFVRFRGRYALMGGFQGREIIGWQRRDELAAKLSTLMYRVEDLAELELPDSTEEVLSVELSRAERLPYQYMEQNLVLSLQNGLEISSPNCLVKLLRLQQLAGGFIHDGCSGEGTRFGDSKEKALLDFLEDINEPVVVCCRFREDLRAVQRTAEKLGRKYGEVSGERNDISGKWEGDEMVLGVQIQAGGLGIDLTRARICVLYSTGFSLGDYLQFRARVLRPGQTRPVSYYHLVARDTVEETISESLREKQDIIESVTSLLLKRG